MRSIPPARFSRRKSRSIKTALEPLESRTLFSAPLSYTIHGPGGGGAFFAPSFNPTNPNEMWVTSDESPVLHTTNLGQSWSITNWTQFTGGRSSLVQYTSTPGTLYSVMNTDAGASFPIKSTDSGATWTPSSGWSAGINGNAYRLYADPASSTRIVVASDTGIYLSTNGGTSFTGNLFGTTNLYVGGVFFDPSSTAIYLGTNKGLLKSTANGAFAAQVPALTAAQGEMVSFTGARDPVSGKILLVCSTVTVGLTAPGITIESISNSYKGIYSLDLSLASPAWTLRTTGLRAGDKLYFVSMSIADINNIYCSGSGGGSPTVYKSTNGGANWSLSFKNSATGGTTNQNIYTGWQGDGGDSSFGFGGQALDFNVDPANPNYVAVTDYGYLHVSTDGGTTWHQMYETAAYENNKGVTTPKNKAYLSSGLEDTEIHSLTWVSATNMFAGYTDIKALRSLDGGNTWSFPSLTNLQNTQYKVDYDPISGNIYAATASVHDMYQTWIRNDSQINGSSGYLTVSSNQGLNWTIVHNFSSGAVVWEQLDPNDLTGNTMYVATVNSDTAKGGIWKTTNLRMGASSTWTHLATPPRTEGHAYNIRVLNDGSLVVSFSDHNNGGFTASSGVFYSIDGGASWIDRSDAGMLYYTKDVVIDPTDSTQNTWYAGVRNTFPNAAAGSSSGGLYKTTDRGQHWTEIYSMAGIDGGVESITINPATAEMYITTENAGLLYSANAAVANPVIVSTNYPFFHPYRVFINPYNAKDVWIGSAGYSLVEVNNSTVSGRVFQDINSDGVFTVNSDTGFSTVSVYLDLNNSGSFLAGDPTTTTDALGNYSFANLAKGLNGTVRLNPQPGGYVETNTAVTGFATTPGSVSTVNIAFFPTVFTGTAAADTYNLSLSGQNDVIIKNGITFTVLKSLLPSLTFNPQAGSNALTVDLSGGNPVPAGGVTFNGGANTDSLNVTASSGNNNISVSGTQVIANNFAINYSGVETIAISTGTGNDTLTQTAQPGNAAALSFSGGTGTDALIINGGAFTIPIDPSSNGTTSLAVTVGAGASLAFSGNNASTHGIRPYHLASLTVNGTASLAAAASALVADRTLLTTSILNVSNKLDLTSNDIDVHYLGGATPFSTLHTAIKSGAIFSSLANSAHAVGYADGADGVVSGLAAGDVLLRYTVMGDSNLDGLVNFSDLVQLSQHYNATNGLWDTGDFNDDGTVNFSDLVALSQNYNSSLP